MEENEPKCPQEYKGVKWTDEERTNEGFEDRNMDITDRNAQQATPASRTSNKHSEIANTGRECASCSGDMRNVESTVNDCVLKTSTKFVHSCVIQTKSNKFKQSQSLKIS